MNFTASRRKSRDTTPIRRPRVLDYSNRSLNSRTIRPLLRRTSFASRNALRSLSFRSDTTNVNENFKVFRMPHNSPISDLLIKERLLNQLTQRYFVAPANHRSDTHMV